MPPSKFYAIIAGVGSGTGRSVALRFAKTYPVVLLARKPDSYNDIVSEIKAAGGQAIGISTDTSDTQSVISAFETIKKEFPEGKLAAAICRFLDMPHIQARLLRIRNNQPTTTTSDNASGGFARKPFLEQTIEELQSSFAGSPYVHTPDQNHTH